MPATPGSDSTAISKLNAVNTLPEPPNINYPFEPVMWNYHGSPVPHKTLAFGDRMTSASLTLSTSTASTVTVVVEDDDFTFFSNELFSNWAFNIEDVSVDSYRQFNIKKLKPNTDNAYLGEESDLEWILGQRPIDTEVGGVIFRLCNLNPVQNQVTVIFEDRAASYLRTQSGVLSWDRSQHTRAQFVAMLCRQAGVDYFIPEINEKQPVDVVDQQGNNVVTSPTGKSISSMANLTVKGHPMTPTQKKIAASICAYGERFGAKPDAVAAVLFDCIYESSMGADPSNHGILGGVSGNFASNLSSAGAEITAAFQGGSGYTSAISLAKQFPGDIAKIGVNCTRPSTASGVLNPANTQYATQHVPGGLQGTVNEAENILAAYGGVAEVKSNSTLTTSSKTNYAFTRGANEDSYDCIQRLAYEVGWYAFVRQNRLWYVSGNYLWQQNSTMVVEAGKDGITWVDADLDMGARDQTAEVDVYARTDYWTALPGDMISVSNRGPATGKWMVNEVTVPLLDLSQESEIICYKPVPKQAEPVDNTTIADSGAGVLSSGAGSVTSAFQAAKSLSNKKTIYTRNVRTLVALNQIPQGATMFDCSSSVSEVLTLAGFKLPGGASYGAWAPTTDVDWGSVMKQGQGKQMTIWISPTSVSGSDAHMFMEFNIPGQGHWQGNTDCSVDNAGFRLERWGPMGSVDAAGGKFTPWHYPGT